MKVLLRPLLLFYKLASRNLVSISNRLFQIFVSFFSFCFVFFLSGYFFSSLMSLRGYLNVSPIVYSFLRMWCSYLYCFVLSFVFCFCTAFHSCQTELQYGHSENFFSPKKDTNSKNYRHSGYFYIVFCKYRRFTC